MGDGSKLTLVPTVEAGLMVNGWGPVAWSPNVGVGGQPLLPSMVSFTHMWNPLPAREAPQPAGPPAPVSRPWLGVVLRAASPLSL